MPTKVTPPKRKSRKIASNEKLGDATENARFLVADAGRSRHKSVKEFFLRNIDVSEIYAYFKRTPISREIDHNAALLAALDKWLNHRRVSPESSATARALFKAGMEAVTLAGPPLPTKSARTSPQSATAPSHPLPPPPDGKKWPQARVAGIFENERTDDDYDRYERFGKRGGLKEYLSTVWSPELLASIEMPTFREHWPKAAVSIDQQRKKLENDGVALPATGAEVTYRKAEANPDRENRPWRVERAMQARDYRARRKLAR